MAEPSQVEHWWLEEDDDDEVLDTARILAEKAAPMLERLEKLLLCAACGQTVEDPVWSICNHLMCLECHLSRKGSECAAKGCQMPLLNKEAKRWHVGRNLLERMSGLRTLLDEYESTQRQCDAMRDDDEDEDDRRAGAARGELPKDSYERLFDEEDSLSDHRSGVHSDYSDSNSTRRHPSDSDSQHCSTSDYSSDSGSTGDAGEAVTGFTFHTRNVGTDNVDHHGSGQLRSQQQQQQQFTREQLEQQERVREELPSFQELFDDMSSPDMEDVEADHAPKETFSGDLPSSMPSLEPPTQRTLSLTQGLQRNMSELSSQEPIQRGLSLGSEGDDQIVMPPRRDAKMVFPLTQRAQVLRDTRSRSRGSTGAYALPDGTSNSHSRLLEESIDLSSASHSSASEVDVDQIQVTPLSSDTN
ncbi:MAG: hypothetical protein MHM6MM_006251 [Cercozoa sp. M6MM]